MHILYFHQHFTTPDGAGGTRSYEMAQRAIAQGHKVTMVCGSYRGGATGLTQAFKRGKRQGRGQSIDVIEFDLGYSNAQGFLKRTAVFLKFAMSSTKIALFTKYDVVFATTTPLTAGIPGIFARWLRRKPFVFEVRDLWPELPREMGVIKNPLVLAAMSALEWLSYRSAHRCVALSPGIKNGIQRRGVSEKRITIVPNGCDLALFSSAAPKRPEGIKKTDLLAVFAGTHGQANGLDAVLDAAAVLKQRAVTDIKILLVGGGKLKPALVERQRSEGLSNVVMLDPIPKNQLANVVASADIGIQCLANIPAFYFGTSPNKFFDYIAAGLPVLNNYPGWLTELITENACGIAIPPDDPSAFADALQAAHGDREKLQAQGQAAAKLARDSFDRDLLGAQWVDWVVNAGKKQG